MIDKAVHTAAGCASDACINGETPQPLHVEFR
jgi:hypothetical protein